MAVMEQIETLMSDVGPVLDPLAIDAMPEAKCWGIAMEEDLSVLVEFDEQKNCLVLSSELGAPAPGDRTALYELLLQLNYHWNATGGNRMAVNGPGGDIVQMYELGADNLDATQLSAVLKTFSEVAKAWRQVVQQPSSAQTSTLDAHHIGLRI
jgi:hypothetical protein